MVTNDCVCTKQFRTTLYLPYGFTPKQNTRFFSLARRRSHSVSVLCARWTARVVGNTEIVNMERIQLSLTHVCFPLVLNDSTTETVSDGWLNPRSSVTFHETFVFCVLWNNKVPGIDIWTFLWIHKIVFMH